MALIKPLTTEKAIKLLEMENKLVFLVERKTNKSEIKKEIEKSFNVKVDNVGTHISKNRKIAYIKLKKENRAIDVATKLGLI